jgi:outer membrane protein OmpA-like peptidoglycan-associated protein
MLICLRFRKIIFSFFFFLFLHVSAHAQNYFANADFEKLNNCSEYKQDCSPEAWFYLRPAVTPIIYHNEVPRPFTGKDLMIVQVENVFKKITNRSFIYTMFCCPLVAGKDYKLSFYINTKGNKFEGIDFHFSPKEFISSNFNYDSLQPTIHISDTNAVAANGNWKYVETIYKAKGNEKFCYIGNMQKNAFNVNVHNRMNKAGDVYYFIDDIAFAPTLPEKLCAQYQANIDKLYAQNLRHTEATLVVPLPKFITDTIIIPAVYFENDMAIIKPAFKNILLKVIKKTKNKNIESIEIEGHTDSNGTEEHNIVLSEKRALAVKEFLTENLKVEKERILAVGKAATIPIADNKTKEGRAKNRRVQLVFTYNID